MRLDSNIEGVVVIEVADDAPALGVGFKKGDVILSVNNQKISKTADLDRVTKESARFWRITVLRDGQQLSVTLGG